MLPLARECAADLDSKGLWCFGGRGGRGTPGVNAPPPGCVPGLLQVDGSSCSFNAIIDEEPDAEGLMLW